MPYVIRNAEGRITHYYLTENEGVETEWLADDHPDALAWRNPPPSLDDYRRAIEALTAATAHARDYASAESIAGYVNSTVPAWAAEGQAFVAWRDAVWIYAFTELDRVTNGEREQPTIDDLIAELPVIEWPA